MIGHPEVGGRTTRVKHVTARTKSAVIIAAFGAIVLLHRLLTSLAVSILLTAGAELDTAPSSSGPLSSSLYLSSGDLDSMSACAQLVL